jgi:diguanylate cyclase (GGDEF)-like protein
VNRRRAEDRPLRLVLGASEPTDSELAPPGSEPDPLNWTAYQWHPGATPEPRAVPDIAESEESTLLLDVDAAEAILIAGAAVRRLPRGTGREDLLERAAAGAVAWERERKQIHRWLRLPDRLLAFAERLSRADTVPEVCRVLSEGTAEIVGAYEALLLLREKDAAPPHAGTRLATRNGRMLTVRSHPRLWRPGIVTAAEARADVGGPFSSLSHLFAETGAATIAYTPVGNEGILFLVERRRDRIFEPEDWNLLRNLASQADGTLRRVYSMEEIHQLSLTDPLTGLANRRRLDVVMEHAWALARRGKPLAVILIDLDHFKRLNDEQGHLAGDRFLRLVAEVLQEAVRASDLVVRYGGDEFLVLLPGESAQAAYAVIARVQDRLAGRVEFSAGIAQYHAGLSSIQELLEEADRNLYAVKRQMRWHPE